MADPHYLNLLNHSWPFDCLVVSLTSGQGYFTFLYGHTRHNIQTRGWKKRRTNNHGHGLAPIVRKKFVILLYISVHLWAIASVYSSEIPTQALGMLTHPLTLAKPASGSTGPSNRLSLTVGFSRLLLTALSYWLSRFSADFLLLFVAFHCLFLVSWEISCASPLCGFRSKTKESPTPTETNANYRATELNSEVEQALINKAYIYVPVV